MKLTLPSMSQQETEWDDPHDKAYLKQQQHTRHNNNTIFSDDEDGHSSFAGGMLSSLLLSRSSQPSSGGFIDPMLTSPAYHIHQAENALSTLKQVVAEDGWKKALKHKSGVVVHMKNGINRDDKTPIFKGQAVIHGFSPQSVFYVIGMRKLWDENYEDGSLIENLNETTSLTYEVSKPTATSKPRDTVLIEKIECGQDGSIIFACTSVESPRAPRVPGRVRAHIKLQGWVLEPIRGPTPATKVTYVIQESLKGWVTGFAKKSLARRPLVIALVNDYLQRKADRMRAKKMASQQSLMVRNSRQHATRPSIQTTNTLSDPLSASTSRGQRSQQNHKTSSPNSFVSSSCNMSPVSSHRSILCGPVSAQSHGSADTAPNNTKRRITFAHQDIAYSSGSLVDSTDQSSSEASHVKITETTTASPPRPSPPPTTAVPSRHLYPSHRHQSKKIESLRLLKQLSSTLDGWLSECEEDGVTVYSRKEDGKRPYFRGDSVIEGGWSPEQLCSVVHCYGARKIWDKNFESGRIVERFSQKDYLVCWSLRSPHSLNRCDISAITSIETDPVRGVIYTASTSVVDAAIPPPNESELCVPGQLGLYGWVFSPNVDSKGRIQSVNVTMIWSMDDAFQVLADKTAAVCISGLRQYVLEHGCPPYIRRVAGKVVNENFETKTRTYQMTFIAKHEPSSSYRARKSASGRDSWYTDIRIHQSVYPSGLDVKVSPTQGTRVEMTTDHRSVRIYTTSTDMEGKHVVVHLTAAAAAAVEAATLTESPISPTQKDDDNDSPATEKPPARVADTITQTPARYDPSTTDTPVPMSPSSFSHVSTISSTLQVPKGYTLVPHNNQNNNVIIISDELAFNGQQLALVFIAMVLCYYMGKFACTC